MVLEAVMICLDNSDYSRNGDFMPSRLEAQQDTANLICGAKVQSNPENAVGLLTMAGKRVSVEASPTPDMGLFVQALHGIPCDGKIDIIKGIQTAQLALKHRINRNQRQRIIVFVCSPIDATEPQLEQLGKLLKKNNVALDLISFGEVQDNSRLLKKLWLAVNSNETSHLHEETEEGINLATAVMSSPMLAGETGGFVSAPGDMGGASGANEFGVDPYADPELYMALRLSLEDERARQQRRQPTEMRTGGLTTGATETTPDGPAPNITSTQINAQEGPTARLVNIDTPQVTEANLGEETDQPPSAEEIMAMDIDEDLRQALLLSLHDCAPTPGEDMSDQNSLDPAHVKKRILSGTSRDNISDQPPQKRPRDVQEREGETENPETGVEKAPESTNSTPHSFTHRPVVPGSGATAAATSIASDPELLSHIMNSVPGVDFSNPEVQAALRAIGVTGEQSRNRPGADGEDPPEDGNPPNNGSDTNQREK